MACPVPHTTDDKIDGVNVPHSLERTLGRGAGVHFSNSTTWSRLNGYTETAVRNRPSGLSVAMRISSVIPSAGANP
jgi:hypothetical protein